MCLWKHFTAPLISRLLSVWQAERGAAGLRDRGSELLSVMSHAIGHGAVAETSPEGVSRVRDKAVGAVVVLSEKVCVRHVLMPIAGQKAKH